MADLTNLSTEIENMQTLPDEPTTTASALKILMDKAPKDIKDFINNTLIPELETILSKLDNVTAERLENNLPKLDNVTATQLEYLIGLTASITSLLAAKQPTILSGTAAPSSLSDGQIYLRYPS